jgi:hypothetical protein
MTYVLIQVYSEMSNEMYRNICRTVGLNRNRTVDLKKWSKIVQTLDPAPWSVVNLIRECQYHSLRTILTKII